MCVPASALCCINTLCFAISPWDTQNFVFLAKRISFHFFVVILQLKVIWSNKGCIGDTLSSPFICVERKNYYQYIHNNETGVHTWQLNVLAELTRSGKCEIWTRFLSVFFLCYSINHARWAPITDKQFLPLALSTKCSSNMSNGLYFFFQLSGLIKKKNMDSGICFYVDKTQVV